MAQVETGDGLGSGVIYSSEGHVLTAAHVVEDARSEVTVRIADGTTVEGDVLGADRQSDVAVLKIPGRPELPVATLALGVPVQVGQMAIAVGSPFGLDQTVTAGVVSAVDRAVPTRHGAVSMIQTDAPINPGSSGGALADRRGRVIGINSAIRTRTGGNVGVGFAIPIDLAKLVADKIVAGEPFAYAFLGVHTAALAGGPDGSLIVAVVPNSPADEAGLRRGDRVVAVDGDAIRDPVDLLAEIRSHRAGDRVVIAYERDGREDTTTVHLGRQQEAPATPR